MLSMRNIKQMCKSHRWMAWFMMMAGAALLSLSSLEPSVHALGSPNPAQVTTLANVTQVAGGLQHSLFLKSDGTVYAVGANGSGQLGDGTTTNRTTAVQVSGLTNVVEIAAGAAFSLARKSDGTVYAWGDNSYGELGNGTSPSSCTVSYPSVSYSNTPVQVNGVSSATGIAAGAWHGVALISGGTVKTWGRNTYGQLGNGAGGDFTENYDTRCVQSASGVTDATQVAAGQNHSVILRGNNSGKLKAWGNNGDGQLADGTNTLRNSPVTMVIFNDVTFLYETFTGGIFVSASANTTAVVNSGNKVLTAGNNGRGQLGQGCGTISSRNFLNKIGSFSSVLKAVGGSTSEHFVALKSDGTLWAWGRNDYGQLGDGSNTDQCPPVAVVDSMGATITGFSSPAAGGLHSLAIKSDAMSIARAWTWGDNTFGQLGR